MKFLEAFDSYSATFEIPLVQGDFIIRDGDEVCGVCLLTAVLIGSGCPVRAIEAAVAEERKSIRASWPHLESLFRTYNVPADTSAIADAINFFDSTEDDDNGNPTVRTDAEIRQFLASLDRRTS